MDFTREPLVETIITPKEGYKLVIRATSGNNQEEYSVSAVEIVAFGNCFFFRSLEKPKAFLLPMTEYEVVEARETRTVLKKPQVEKSIKIGERKKPVPKTAKGNEEEETPKEGPKKRERKRTRKRRPKGEKEEVALEKADEKKTEEKKADEKVEGEAAPIRRTLLPPPTSLISEQIDRYKHYLAEHGALLPEEMESESKVEELKPETDESPSFPFGEEATPQTPTLSEETPPTEEDKVVDITEEAHVPPEDNES